MSNKDKYEVKGINNTSEEISCNEDLYNENGISDIEGSEHSVLHTGLVESVKKRMPETEKLRETAELLKIFGDYTRIRVLWSLGLETMSVCCIADLLGMTKSAVSHQLRVLRQAKLVKTERKGKEIYYSLADDHVSRILDMAMEHIEE